MKGCRQAKQRLFLRADHRLSVEEAFALEDHLDSCESCARMAVEFSLLNEVLAESPEPPLERLDVEAAVLRIGAAAEGASTRSARTSSRTRRRLALAAGLLLAASSAVFLWAWQRGALSSQGTGSDGAHVAEHPGRGVSNDAVADPEMAASVEPAVVAVVPEEGGAPGIPEGTNARGERDELDSERLQNARRELSIALVNSFSGEDLSLAVEEFERRAAGLRERGWSLRRNAEALLHDRDDAVVRAAARYLGRRGDGVSAVQLRWLLTHREATTALAREAILALADLGPLGADGLEEGLRVPGVEELALATLVQSGGEHAAMALERELLRLRSELHARQSADSKDMTEVLVQGLVEIGAPAVESILRLAAAGDAPVAGPSGSAGLDQEFLLGQLVRIEGAESALERIVAASADPRSKREFEVPLLLAASAHLQTAPLLDWVAELCLDSNVRESALETLSLWRGAAPLAALLHLDRQGRVGQDDVRETLGRLIRADQRRCEDFAKSQIAAGDQESSRRLLELLVEVEEPGGAGALVVLALADLLPDDDRQWAALAAGELGDWSVAERLSQGLASLDAGDRRLRAAMLLSIYVLTGEAGLADTLVSLPRRDYDRVLSVLDETARRGVGAVRLQRVVRVLDSTSAFTKPKYGKSNP